LTYSEYLKIDELLTLNQPVSDAHDEFLFISVHQVYEIWFKQIIHELDSVRDVFLQPKVEERNMLMLNRRLGRIVGILKILVDQMMILETMTPHEFADFRNHLQSSSGFQSWQFRLLENKLGIKKENRIRYNNSNYSEAFSGNITHRNLIEDSENQPSVFDLVQTWLERTPGLEKSGFNFWEKFTNCCRSWLDDELQEIMMCPDSSDRGIRVEAHRKNEENFNTILVEEKYNTLLARGDRRLSWRALQGALMISFYQDEVIFHQPFRMLTLLMDIDSLITKWRYNHVMLVQRQLGTKLGSGGSSGYQYLRSTVSDRYKAFLDFFNLSNYLVPREYLPPLLKPERTRLASVCMPSIDQETGEAAEIGEC